MMGYFAADLNETITDLTPPGYVVIPAGYTPEDWAYYGPLVMERLRAELAGDPDELDDDDIKPDKAEPLPDEEPVKTEPVPEEPQ